MKKELFNRNVVVILVCLAGILGFSNSLFAVDYLVGNEKQLSDAIKASNVSGREDTIRLVRNIEIQLPLPAIHKRTGVLLIDGSGFVLSRVSGLVEDFRLLTILSSEVRIRNLTLTGGRSVLAYSQEGIGGGAVYNFRSRLTMEQVTLRDNAAGYGGAIYNNKASLWLIHCKVHGNEAVNGAGMNNVNSRVVLMDCEVSNNNGHNGGGIMNQEDSSLVLERTSIVSNTGNSVAGGIWNWNSSVVMSESEVSGNIGVGGAGGILNENSTLEARQSKIRNNRAGQGAGISNTGQSNANLIDVEMTGNTAENSGGAILNAGSTLSATRVTIADNTASAINIFNSSSSSMTLENCTVTGNIATSGAGGIVNGADSKMKIFHTTITGNRGVDCGGIVNDGDMNLTGSVVSGNRGTEQVAGEIYASGGTIRANRFNVLGDMELTLAEAFVGFVPGEDDLTCNSDGSKPAKLKAIIDIALAENGGYTRTHALPAGSPAVDLAPKGPATDQRGLQRPQGEGFDSGSYERDPDEEEKPLVEDHWHRTVLKAMGMRVWELDPNGLLGVNPTHVVISGTLPQGLEFDGKNLQGSIKDPGLYTFSVASGDGRSEVRNHFRIRVVAAPITRRSS